MTLDFILWRMNLLVFSLMSKANITNSKYRCFLLLEVELFGLQVFTSRSISDVFSSASSVPSSLFTIFSASRELQDVRRKAIKFDICLSAHGFAQKVKKKTPP